MTATEPADLQKPVDCMNRPPDDGDMTVGQARGKFVPMPAHSRLAVRVEHADGSFTDMPITGITAFPPTKSGRPGLTVIRVKGAP